MKKSLILALFSLGILLASTSCKDTVSSGHYVQVGEMSSNMSANLLVQTAVTAANEEYNAIEMCNVRPDKEAISAFKSFAVTLEQTIEALDLPILGDTWVDLELMNLDQQVIATERLSIE